MKCSTYRLVSSQPEKSISTCSIMIYVNICKYIGHTIFLVHWFSKSSLGPPLDAYHPSGCLQGRTFLMILLRPCLSFQSVSFWKYRCIFQGLHDTAGDCIPKQIRGSSCLLLSIMSCRFKTMSLFSIHLCVYLKNISLLISNTVNIGKYNPHKQKFSGVLNHF